MLPLLLKRQNRGAKMYKKLTTAEIKIIECVAFQRAEDNVTDGFWTESFANIFLELVHECPEKFTYLTMEV